MTRLLTHIRAPPPQWVNNVRDDFSDAIQILFRFHYSCSPSGRVSFRVNFVCLCVRISISQEWHYIFISPKRQPPVTNGIPTQTPRRTRLWGLIVILKKLLNKQSNFMWFKTAWYSCDVTVVASRAAVNGCQRWEASNVIRCGIGVQISTALYVISMCFLYILPETLRHYFEMKCNGLA